MANLRILQITVLDSTNIKARFTDNLSENISVKNISILSQTPGVPSSEVISVNIIGDTLEIQCQPLTSQAAYFISFQSVVGVPFQSLNGNAFILNDNITNKQIIIGPIEESNPIKEYLTNYFRNNVYDLQEPSIISKYINGLSLILSQSLYDIRQAKNENYLSYTIVDEPHTRSGGPFDRLNEEAAYEILRVGINKTGAIAPQTTKISSFPNYPVSLRAVNNSETLTIDTTDRSGTFNLNNFILNLSKRFIIKLTNITFVYIGSSYVYDISKYGYQIYNSVYDPDVAFTYFQLLDSQIKLNDKILSDPAFSTDNIEFIQVSYQYKDTGKIIDPSSLVVDTVLPSGREPTPAIENIFSLQHAPIVNKNDVDGIAGDVIFIDPNALPGSNSLHPAFTTEIQFRLDYLPSRPGEYAVDYPTGNIYVYGQSSANDGTGPFPPLATYYYRYVFKSEIDYVYDQDVADLVSLPNGSLINSSTNIIYNYEQVFAQDIDYKVASHIEVLNERIENKLLALNVIQPQNFPITNVFRIFNETTGEIYKTLRWSDNKIYFNYNNAPNIEPIVSERASFADVLNETLFVSASSVLDGYLNIFKIFLNNNNIIAASEDCIGSSFNTSIKFSNENVFTQELYFDNNLTNNVNNTKLVVSGNYQVDYINGIVWVAIPNTHDFSIGTVSYKKGYIVSQHPHIITVDDIYYKVNVLNQKNKTFDYTNFSDTEILPSSFDVANEEFFNDDILYPYQISNEQVGTFNNASFVNGVSDSVKYVRSLFEYQDLSNNKSPINFASSSIVNGTTIKVEPLTFQEYGNVQFDGYDYFVMANTNLLYQSANIILDANITRLSDSASLWDGYHEGTVVNGSPFKLILSGYNSPSAGDAVVLNYSYTINDLSRIVVDYNKGDYFIDYTYLADEIIISYEYGNNALDFRETTAINTGDNYYVSYKVGALRSALLKNFGTLIDIPILNSLDVSFDRERYRDALMAAMQSFTEGPSLTSMKNIVETIVHAPPEIIESAFQNWNIGNSLLNLEPIHTDGEFDLVPAKYGNGVLVNQPGQSISFPLSSNFRLEQGSMEMWVVPQWNGIDNQSSVKFVVKKNGSFVEPQNIFIGPGAYHPTLNATDHSFSLDIKDFNKVFGKPNQSKDGVFIYYNADLGGKFNRWYVDVLDGYGDGYGVKNYSISATTTGKMYDVKSSIIPKPTTSKITSGTNSFVFATNGSAQINQGITFIADDQHYLFDTGKDLSSNRFSIFKDESGYLNFRIFDKNKTQYIISYDVSSWKAGQQHHIATSWAINSKNGKDEMHLFIDGFEVPNIIKYGGKITPYLHEKYRTVSVEEIVGDIPKNIVSSIDLSTIFGSSIVSSSLDFDAYGINSGDILYINEPGFSTSGYTISSVNGNDLLLSVSMPITIDDASFSINKISFQVSTDIDLYKNIAVSLLHTTIIGNDLQATLNSNVVSSTSTNFSNNNIKPGYLLKIDEPSLTSLYTIVSVNNNNLTIDDNIDNNYSNANYFIYENAPVEIPGQRALRPAYEISRDGYFNNILTVIDKALKNDIVLINSLGVNSRIVNQKYYEWGNNSNVLMTRLPSPILLGDVKITHIILPTTNIGPNNSTLSAGIFTSNNIITDQPSISDNGRTLSISISGDNIDYTTPVNADIHGTVGGNTSFVETITFNKNETQNTINKFSQISYIVVNCKPIDDTKNCLTVALKEANIITYAEDSDIVPIIRYSYQMRVGNSLTGTASTNIVRDINSFFSVEDIGNYLMITSPSSVAGQYKIVSISDDHLSLTLDTNLSFSFTNGLYQILNVSDSRSGLQNGFFTFEEKNIPGKPYKLVKGSYDFDYSTYLSMPFTSDNLKAFIGTDINGKNIANAIIDELHIVSEMLTDTRIGETAATNQETITKDFNSVKELQSNINSLMLAHFNTFPFENSTEVYITSSNKFIQSADAVNDNFSKSICITNDPLVIDNAGILNTQTEGSVEFWVNPLIDTGNDPNYRFYFDATSAVSESIISTNNATVKVAGKISKILNVKLKVGNQNIDYFAGGTIDADNQTIFLNKQLPNQQTPVIVNYIPTGTNGDRVSIYKDPYGYINFNIRASNTDYLVRAPAFWTKDTWHRLKATFKMNKGIGTDEVRFFVDGYEIGNILFGENLLFNQGAVFGSYFLGHNGITASIIFNDTINELVIGSDYTRTYGAYALIDNLRISNISRPIFMPFGEPIDANYSKNTNIVFPVSEDLYTTLLLNFDTLVQKNTNFSTLKNKKTGLFDFSVNIFDVFDIVKDSNKVKTVLETLINVLKPANSRVFIRYIDR